MANIDEVAEIPNKSENTKMPDVRHIFSETDYTTSSQSRSEIQSIQSGFQLSEFNDNKKGQACKPIEKKNTITYMANILIN